MPISVGAQSPTKIPNRSACAGSSPTNDHVAIEKPTDTIDAIKHVREIKALFISFLLLYIIFFGAAFFKLRFLPLYESDLYLDKQKNAK